MSCVELPFGESETNDMCDLSDEPLDYVLPRTRKLEGWYIFQVGQLVSEFTVVTGRIGTWGAGSG